MNIVKASKIFTNFAQKAKELGFYNGPYYRLMRLHQPVGIYLLLFPILWTIAAAVHSFSHFILWSLYFTLCSIIMRASGCIINDIMDANIDAQVARTASRPLASGELSIKQAIYTLCGLLSLAFVLLLFLPKTALLIAIFAVIPITLYPLAKRYINYPQVMLGLTFNLGVLVAWYALNDKYRDINGFMLYLGSAVWTIGYDTIYAHQDKKYDAIIGIGSTALAFGKDTKNIVLKLYVLFISSIGLTGITLGMNLLFYGFILLALWSLNNQVEKVNLDDAEDCRKKFMSNVQCGILVLVGIILGKTHL